MILKVWSALKFYFLAEKIKRKHENTVVFKKTYVNHLQIDLLYYFKHLQSHDKLLRTIHSTHNMYCSTHRLTTYLHKYFWKFHLFEFFMYCFKTFFDIGLPFHCNKKLTIEVWLFAIKSTQAFSKICGIHNVTTTAWN